MSSVKKKPAWLMIIRAYAANILGMTIIQQCQP